jgi:ubiquinone/menaquinone biosynthesis C-methylase UbiE
VAESKREFFDRIASQWDGRVDLEQLAHTLRQGLLESRVAPDGTIVDLGCGTGNLTLALLEQLGSEGRVLAVDFSSHMIGEARRKVRDSRVRWLVADASELPLNNADADDVICFSAWPHFPQPARVLAEVRRVLRPGGKLCIWHAASRTTISQIHARAGGAIENDCLPPGTELAALANAAGLDPFEVIDDDQRYVVRARAPQTHDRRSRP